jgi:predicted nucleic acid-binding protein
LHARALRDLDRIGRRPIVLCESILTETCFLLAHPVQRERLRRLIVELPIRSFEAEGEELWNEVFAWLSKYGDHDPDWADGYLVAVSSRDTGVKVWTYDKEFATVWRRLDGKKIALLVDPRR